MKSNTNNKKIAIVAGGLALPFFTRDALKENGYDVFVIGIKNFYDPKLKPDMEIRLGGAGKGVRELRRRGINTVTFVGSLGHPNLYDIRPDLWSLGVLLSVLKHQRGYDSMAVTVNKIIEKRGFKIIAAQDVAPQLTFETAGTKTKLKPSKKDEENIKRAIEVSHVIGEQDIGASVVVDNQVIAVEAAEGTARMLDRVIKLRTKTKHSSGVFAKMTKPNQDLRIDIPAIGVDTIKSVVAAKLRGIVINSKTCFIIDKEKVLELANKHKIFIKVID